MWSNDEYLFDSIGDQELNCESKNADIADWEETLQG
jgi:hypothetical protein